ncbi:MAG: response regulator [Myxococcales bacterium]|nr:response regulator [Myxococcales bacterium]
MKPNTDSRNLEADVRLLQSIFASIQDGISILDRDFRILMVNPVMERWYAHARPLVGKRCFEAYHLRDRHCEICPSRRTLDSGEAARESVPLTGEGGRITGWLDLYSFPLIDIHTGKLTGVIEYVRDITAQRRAEDEAKKLAAQLAQSQKMEAVGRLAGGVAHDFNNLLTVIMGRSDMLRREIPDAHPWAREMTEILEAAQRAASLTQQLLAFSRRQVIDPKPLDLNHIIERSGALLRRLIGEDIHVEVIAGANLPRVLCDAHQIEQILMNLTVNARDAMPDGGKLTIETSVVVIDQEYARLHPEARPGSYVMLAVSDSGCGMSSEVKAHLFEPFFTTKGRGQGSGLGLSTVYGIVRQNRGFINVYSEEGVGSSFKIYLPATSDAASVESPEPEGEPGGEETILFVEDSDPVRGFTLQALQRLGYRVLVAASLEEARGIFLGQPVDLLLSDVILPDGNGKVLYQELSQKAPSLRVLYISGYTDNVIAHHGILEKGIAFLQKPFTAGELARALRRVLDRPV